MDPIKPSEVGRQKAAAIPEEVIQTFNELIVKYWDGTRSNFTLKEVAELAATKLDLKNTKMVFGNKWLDVEQIYEKAGWVVEFDKPAYSETYSANFTFRKGKLHNI